MSDRTLDDILHAAGLSCDVRGVRDLSGGCIHRVVEVTLGDDVVVIKVGSRSASALFEEERVGLDRLAAADVIPVPRPIAAVATSSASALVMTRIETCRASDASWRRFGEDLAALHGLDAGMRYGFDIDNHLGSTPQPNAWCDDWVEFNREHRFGHQVRAAAATGAMRSDEAAVIDRVIDRLDRVLPVHPKPALLHGDLWSGNAMPTSGDRVAVIDPAPYVGDGWADVAMMRLFGGFPDACHRAYAAAADDHDEVERRIAAYQLYHLLNHVTIFGRGYVGQAMSLARGLLA